MATASAVTLHNRDAKTRLMLNFLTCHKPNYFIKKYNFYAYIDIVVPDFSYK